ncbi:S-adenosyl-L-methionine-dependent methyltransferase [Coniochaeta sp. PMI_546]|nr:S-adenosyl-L-methionine-dependent methyltransferase [Coniochaeta sp. PMI_546]
MSTSTQPQPHLSHPQQSPTPDTPTEDHDPALYEQVHVHKVYSQIAPHFSATRHKPWPLVSRFLLDQPPGAVGLDVGCGNGKYLSVNPDLYLVGSDRSEELVRLARDGLDVRAEGQGLAVGGPKREVMTADGLALPFRDGVVDFVISVAVVHHFSTRQRRVDGIRALLGCVRPARRKDGGDGGRVMVYVWALEQGNSRRGWDEGTEQDQLVPWVMKQQQQSKKKKGKRGEGGGGEEGEKGVEGEEKTKVEEERTYQRYYHLYRKGELEEDVVAAGGSVLESGYERDNWWVIAANVVT